MAAVQNQRFSQKKVTADETEHTQVSPELSAEDQSQALQHYTTLPKSSRLCRVMPDFWMPYIISNSNNKHQQQQKSPDAHRGTLRHVTNEYAVDVELSIAALPGITFWCAVRESHRNSEPALAVKARASNFSKNSLSCITAELIVTHCILHSYPLQYMFGSCLVLGSKVP